MAADQLPDPSNLGSGPDQLIRVGIAFLVVSWVSMFLRAWTRAVIIRSLGWDDYTMVLTMGAFTVQCSYVIKVGMLEKHPENLQTIPQLSAIVTDVIAFSGAYIATTIVLKISLALFFLRIIVQKWQRNFIIYSLIVYIIYTTVYFGLVVFGCGAPSKYLIHTAEQKCVSVKDIVIPMSYAQTAFNALMDWIYVILPIHTLWFLNMPRRTKMWASLLILLGAFGSIASLIRLDSVRGLEPGRYFFRDSVPTTVWATIEPGLGITALSLATTRPMFKRFIESSRTGYSRDRSAIAKTGTSRGELSSKGIVLSTRSAPVRAGFREFGTTASEETDVELTSVQHIGEKHGPEKPTKSGWL